MRTFVVLLLCLVACGGTITSGSDASTDAKVDVSVADASKDAPFADADASSTCPAPRPQRLTPCNELDQLCIYPCGIAMRCTPKGWDNDTTVDAGPPCP